MLEGDFAEANKDSFEIFSVFVFLVEDRDGYLEQVGVGADGVAGEGLQDC